MQERRDVGRGCFAELRRRSGGALEADDPHLARVSGAQAFRLQRPVDDAARVGLRQCPGDRERSAQCAAAGVRTESQLPRRCCLV
jgi:hypothetical protein